MNRTTIGYLVMTVLAGGLLWGILRIGSTLHAPADWSGNWKIVQSAETGDAVIEQSGVFLVLKIEHTPARAYKIEPGIDHSTLRTADHEYRVSTEIEKEGTLLKIVDPTHAAPTLRLWREKANAPR